MPEAHGIGTRCCLIFTYDKHIKISSLDIYDQIEASNLLPVDKHCSFLPKCHASTRHTSLIPLSNNKT